MTETRQENYVLNPTVNERELDERLAESFQRAAGGGHVVGPIIREPLEAIYHVISSQHTTNPTILSSLGESWILDEWLVVGGVEGGNDDRNDDWNGARQRRRGCDQVNGPKVAKFLDR